MNYQSDLKVGTNTTRVGYCFPRNTNEKLFDSLYSWETMNEIGFFLLDANRWNNHIMFSLCLPG